ncbi:hypothetical protein [Aliisedimentitalea scapharcae]|uniref:hypothetical protein n=1 Tax=Aliisedimentitalea scapharcae TaxID=1524259 RepID=UPI003872CC78
MACASARWNVPSPATSGPRSTAHQPRPPAETPAIRVQAARKAPHKARRCPPTPASRPP